MARYIRVVSICLLGVLAVAGVAPRVLAQTVDEIIARNIAARGGADKIQAIQTMKQTGHLKIQGMSATMTLYAKRPNLSRQEVNIAGATLIVAFDGATAWGVNPMMGQTTPQTLAGPQAEQARQQATFDPPLMDYKARGSKVELVGNEPGAAGSTLIHLRLTDKAGVVFQVYLDSQTALETKVVTNGPTGANGPTGPVETSLGDYRDVDGIKMPFAIKTTAGGVVVADISVDAIQFNASLAPTLFTMPGRL